MPSEADKDHASAETIVDYLARLLPKAQEYGLDRHFADCGECAEMARRLRVISYLFDKWNAREHGQVASMAALSRTLQKARDLPTNALWRERLDRWLEQWAGSAEGAVRVALGEVEGPAAVRAEGLNWLTRPGAIWGQFIPEVASATRGERSGEAESASESFAVVTPDLAGPRARVEVRDAERSVLVRVERAGPETRLALVMLAPEGGGEPRVAELQAPQDEPTSPAPQDSPPVRAVGLAMSPPEPSAMPAAGQDIVIGEPTLVARFDDVPPGKYIVVFEPVE
jgi:hypothetical protein